MNIKIKFEKRDEVNRRMVTRALVDAGFFVKTESSPRYLDGRVYVHVSDKRIEPD